MPINRHLESERRLSSLLAEEAELAMELAEAQEAYLKAISPAETERLARERLGMVRPGERAFVLPAEEGEIETPEVIEPKKAEEPSLFGRAIDVMVRVFSARI